MADKGDVQRVQPRNMTMLIVLWLIFCSILFSISAFVLNPFRTAKRYSATISSNRSADQENQKRLDSELIETYNTRSLSTISSGEIVESIQRIISNGKLLQKSLEGMGGINSMPKLPLLPSLIPRPGYTLEVSRTFTGLILQAPSNYPVPNALIKAVTSEGWEVDSKTDDNGKFQLFNIPESASNNSCDFSLLIFVNKSNFGSAFASIRLPLMGSSSLSRSISIQPVEDPKRLFFNVREKETNKAISEATISYITRDNYILSFLTDEHGSAIVDISQAVVISSLSVHKRGYYDYVEKVLDSDNHFFNIMLSTNEEISILSGEVRNPEGLPVKGALIFARPEKREKSKRVQTFTDSSGRFELAVPTSDNFEITTSHCLFGERSIKITKVDLQKCNSIVLKYDYITFEGVIETPDGIVPSGARLRVISKETGIVFDAKADDRGGFKIDSLPKGDYLIRFIYPGYFAERSLPNSDSGGLLRVVLKKTAVINGFVFTENCQPVSNVAIVGFGSLAISNEKGRFKLENAWPVSDFLIVSHYTMLKNNEYKLKLPMLWRSNTFSLDETASMENCIILLPMDNWREENNNEE